MRRIFNAIKEKFTAIKSAVCGKLAAIKTEIREDFTPNRQLTAEQRDRKRMRSVKKITAGLMAASMARPLWELPVLPQTRAEAALPRAWKPLIPSLNLLSIG